MAETQGPQVPQEVTQAEGQLGALDQQRKEFLTHVLEGIATIDELPRYLNASIKRNELLMQHNPGTSSELLSRNQRLQTALTGDKTAQIEFCYEEALRLATPDNTVERREVQNIGDELHVAANKGVDIWSGEKQDPFVGKEYLRDPNAMFRNSMHTWEKIAHELQDARRVEQQTEVPSNSAPIEEVPAAPSGGTAPASSSPSGQ